MNYSGKFDAKLPIDDTGAHSHGHLHVDSVSAHALHAPAGAIIVPDAQLLFNGDFKRSGVDLVLSNGDHELVLPDYFKGEKRAALSSPDGAHLTGDIINALTGHQQFAQADGSASVAKVIGHVSKLAGTATAIRNGVSIILNNGDDVQKGDVVQAGSNSTLGITFIDGTVFGLSSNAKMVLNEMVYDPNGSSNSSLISLVAGTISFVAGETAKHGDMKVDTPVATMGIRGTAVLVEIDFDVPQNGAPSAKFQVLVEPDGHTGNYVLFDKVTLAPIATVDQAGVVKSLSQGILTSYSAPLSADVQKLITDVFSLKFTDNTNPNTKSFDHFTDTLLPQAFTPIKLADGATAVPIIVNVNTTGTALSSGPGGPADPHAHIPGPPLVVAVDGALIERIGVTHSSSIDTVTGTINFVDLNAGDTPTVTTKFDSFTYQNAQHQDVTATLNALQLADIAKVEANLLLTPDPANNNNGSVTWNYTVVDSAFDFLAIGETLTLTYEARVDNNFAPNDEFGLQKFTITITRGSNDVPVITTGPQTVPFSGGTTTPGGDLPATAPTSGMLAFTDVDLTDTHTVSAKLTSAVLPGVVIPPGPLAAFEAALSASVAADSTGSGSGTINWKLADLPVFLADFIPKGETLTLTYAVTVTDSQGATASQNIIVTITGTAAPAVVWVATTAPGSPPGGLWSDAANWETGTVPTPNDDVIIITDQLHGLTPSFPVTIKAPAFAKSVTMNDFGSSAPELIDQSTLTISGVLSLAADSIVDNSGTISVGGLMEVLDHSVLHNSGGLTLAQGGDFKNYSTITNTTTGTIDVTGGTLNVQVDIANSGHVTVDSGAKLALASAAIDGGIVTNTGEIDLTGGAVLKNGSLGNSGHIKVSGSGNVLHNEKVTANSALEIIAAGALLLDLGTTVANGGTVTVDDTATLTLNSATIDGGTVTDSGTIHVTGKSAIDSAAVSGGHITVDAGKILTLDGTTVTNTVIADDGTVNVDSSDTLHLSGVTLTGGAVTIGTQGLIVTGGSDTFSGTHVSNDGTIEVHDGTLKISGSVAGAGSVKIDAGAVFELDGSDTQAVVFAGSGAELQIDASTFGGKIVGLTATDELDLRTIGYSAAGTTGTYVGNANGGVLTITDGSKSIGMTLVGDYLHAHFAGASDDHGGTLITLNAADDAPAFVAGEKAQTGTVTELSNTTGSPALDPSPAVSGSIDFKDIDLIDRPTATITAQSVTWTDLSLSLTPAQIHVLERALSLTQSGNTNNGTVGWNYSITDSALDVLAAGQTATVTSTITLSDHQGGTDTATVAITIAGTNDAPTILSETDPATQAVIVLSPVTPVVLAPGVNTNSLGLHTETFNDQSPGSSSNNGQGSGKFDSMALDATFSGSGNAGVVNGSSSVSAAPFVGPLPGTADTTNYLSVGAGGTETITFNDEQNAFGLYWGSVDSYNTISFYHGATLVASYTGADVTPLFPTGNQGSFSSNGYVEFAGLASFDKVVLTSNSNAFEIDDISAGSVPAPHVELAAPITGTLTVGDADIGDTLTASVIGNAVLEYKGSTTIPGNVDVSGLIASKAITFDRVKSDGGADVLHWTYDPTNPNLDFLKSGDTLTITYAAQINDGHGNIGSHPLTVTIAGTNASANLSQFQVVSGTSQNDTFDNVGNHETIFRAGGHDTFVFKPGFGSATIGDFDVNHDTINIDRALATSLSAFLAAAQAANSGHDTILTDTNHDTIKLAGMTVAQIQAHPNDFHLT